MSDSHTLHGAEDAEQRDATEMTNEELFETFIDYARESTKQSTVNFYRTNLRPFVEYVDAADGHITEDVSGRDVEKFIRREITENGLAAKTARHRYSAISRFYNVIRDKEQLLDSGARIPTDKVDKRDINGMADTTMSESSDGEEFHYLEADEVSELIENVPAPELRNRALVMLMVNTGMRASEAQRVRIDGDYLDLDAKSVKVKSPKLSKDQDNEVKWVTYYWRSQAVNDAIDAYINFGRGNFPTSNESPYLFVTKQSERISYSQLNRIVKQAAENAGLQDSIAEDASGTERAVVSSHILRHSWAMNALDNGMNVSEIRDALEHSDLSVTMKYLRRHEDDTKRAVQRDGPQFS